MKLAGKDGVVEHFLMLQSLQRSSLEVQRKQMKSSRQEAAL